MQWVLKGCAGSDEVIVPEIPAWEAEQGEA
jgi:hypothetical protein